MKPDIRPMRYSNDRLREPEILFYERLYGFRCLGLSYGTHPAAYIELPEEYVGVFGNYSFYDMVVSVYGGVTFAQKGGDLDSMLKGYWIGWDYMHLGDKFGKFGALAEHSSKSWTSEDLYKHCKAAAKQLFEFIGEKMEVIEIKSADGVQLVKVKKSDLDQIKTLAVEYSHGYAMDAPKYQCAFTEFLQKEGIVVITDDVIAAVIQL
ncbi:hypothetical protein HNP86_002027 [Methanococcus maripaludis]|uniref:Uncharacterized protein n=1 Tax=Methanococcus maripaludis TaxID=39152 RepID=A0A7J9NVZ4_METMI|nr:hypothetical protein [Methanococcus maripaludis]MBA2851868.1 hypothetical protein [Methanococcus maripaludis]